MENITFTHVHEGNIRQFKRLYTLYPTYKIKTLKNHGEYPCGKKTFRALLDSIAENASCEPLGENTGHFVVMHAQKTIIGFAVFDVRSKQPVTLPYDYGCVGDFFIAPKHRRKGFGRRLNAYMERIFIENGTGCVLLTPDPVTGEKFWTAVGYTDTGLNKGLGRHFVYKKHLAVTENTEKIDRAIAGATTDTDFIGVNPYNKRQIKELFPLWLAYWRKTEEHNHRNPESRRKIKKGLKNRVWFARKTPKNHFYALYFEGKIIGFSWFGIYSGNKDMNGGSEYGYVLEYAIAPAFRRRGFGTRMNTETEKILLRDGASCVYLTPDGVTGLPFWEAIGYTDIGLKSSEEKRPLYVKWLVPDDGTKP